MTRFVGLFGLVLLAGCGGPLSLLTGGGPNVAANVQAGKENRQSVVSVESAAPTVSLRPNSRVDRIDQSTTNNIALPPWAVLLMVTLAAGGAIGWVDNISRLFKKRN